MRSTEVDWGRPSLGQYSGHVLDVIMDLEADILSELKSFNARSAHMGFRS